MRFTIGPSTLSTEDDCDTWSWQFQHRSFYANGRHWVFYQGLKMVWRSSPDGINWSASNDVRNSDYSVSWAVYFDGIFVHYVYEAGSGNALYYRRGTPNADGSISWSAAEQTVLAGVVGIRYYYVTIGVDSDGYPWIGYQYRGAVGNRYPYVIKSSTNDGTWATADNFPYLLKDTANSGWIVVIVPLTANKVYALYSINGQILGKLWNGSWGDEEDSSADPLYSYSLSTTNHDDDVLLIISEITTNNIVFFKRTYGVGWAGGVIVYDGNAEEHPVIAYSPEGFYVFWIPDSNNPVADHVFYRKSVDDGATWTDEAGANANEDWIDESAVGFPSCPESLTVYRHAGAASSYIGFSYTTGAGVPYNLRHAILDADPAAARNILCGFIVRQGSRDLPGGLISRQPPSIFLKAGFKSRFSTEILLSGELIARHGDDQVLKTGFITRNAAFADLHVGVDAIHWRSVPSGFAIRRTRRLNLRAGFWAKVSYTPPLPGSFSVRRSLTGSFKGLLTARHSASGQVKCGFYVALPDSERVYGHFVVRRTAFLNLGAGFITGGRRWLKSGFTIRQWHAEVKGRFSVRILIGSEKVIREDDFKEWFNVVYGVGTGFLSYPSIIDDAVVKVTGLNSGKITIDLLSKQGYKEIVVGHCWKGYRIGGNTNVVKAGFTALHYAGHGYVAVDPGISLIVDDPVGHGGGYAAAYQPGVSLEIDEPVGSGGGYFNRT